MKRLLLLALISMASVSAFADEDTLMVLCKNKKNKTVVKELQELSDAHPGDERIEEIAHEVANSKKKYSLNKIVKDLRETDASEEEIDELITDTVKENNNY